MVCLYLGYWYRHFLSLHSKPFPAQLCLHRLPLLLCGLRVMGECRCCSQPQFAGSLMIIHTSAIIIWYRGTSQGDRDRNSIWRGVQKASNLMPRHSFIWFTSLATNAEVGCRREKCNICAFWLPYFTPLTPQYASLYFFSSKHHIQPFFFSFLIGISGEEALARLTLIMLQQKPTSVTPRRRSEWMATKCRENCFLA